MKVGMSWLTERGLGSFIISCTPAVAILSNYGGISLILLYLSAWLHIHFIFKVLFVYWFFWEGDGKPTRDKALQNWLHVIEGGNPWDSIQIKKKFNEHLGTSFPNVHPKCSLNISICPHLPSLFALEHLHRFPTVGCYWDSFEGLMQARNVAPSSKKKWIASMAALRPGSFKLLRAYLVTKCKK